MLKTLARASFVDREFRFLQFIPHPNRPPQPPAPPPTPPPPPICALSGGGGCETELLGGLSVLEITLKRLSAMIKGSAILNILHDSPFEFFKVVLFSMHSLFIR